MQNITNPQNKSPPPLHQPLPLRLTLPKNPNGKRARENPPVTDVVAQVLNNSADANGQPNPAQKQKPTITLVPKSAPAEGNPTTGKVTSIAAPPIEKLVVHIPTRNIEAELTLHILNCRGELSSFLSEYAKIHVVGNGTEYVRHLPSALLAKQYKLIELLNRLKLIIKQRTEHYAKLNLDPGTFLDANHSLFNLLTIWHTFISIISSILEGNPVTLKNSIFSKILGKPIPYETECSILKAYVVHDPIGKKLQVAGSSCSLIPDAFMTAIACFFWKKESLSWNERMVYQELETLLKETYGGWQSYGENARFAFTVDIIRENNLFDRYTLYNYNWAGLRSLLCLIYNEPMVVTEIPRDEKPEILQEPVLHFDSHNNKGAFVPLTRLVLHNLIKFQQSSRINPNYHQTLPHTLGQFLLPFYLHIYLDQRETNPKAVLELFSFLRDLQSLGVNYRCIELYKHKNRILEDYAQLNPFDKDPLGLEKGGANFSCQSSYDSSQERCKLLQDKPRPLILQKNPDPNEYVKSGRYVKNFGALIIAADRVKRDALQFLATYRVEDLPARRLAFYRTVTQLLDFAGGELSMFYQRYVNLARAPDRMPRQKFGFSIPESPHYMSFDANHAEFPSFEVKFESDFLPLERVVNIFLAYNANQLLLRTYTEMALQAVSLFIPTNKDDAVKPQQKLMRQKGRLLFAFSDGQQMELPMSLNELLQKSWNSLCEFVCWTKLLHILADEERAKQVIAKYPSTILAVRRLFSFAIAKHEQLMRNSPHLWTPEIYTKAFSNLISIYGRDSPFIQETILKVPQFPAFNALMLQYASHTTDRPNTTVLPNPTVPPNPTEVTMKQPAGAQSLVSSGSGPDFNVEEWLGRLFEEDSLNKLAEMPPAEKPSEPPLTKPSEPGVSIVRSQNGEDEMIASGFTNHVASTAVTEQPNDLAPLIEKAGITGLPEVANFCCLNAGLQALMSYKDFAQMLEGPEVADPDFREIKPAIRMLLQHVKSRDTAAAYAASISLKERLLQMKTFQEKAGTIGGNQKDAQEIMSVILNACGHTFHERFTRVGTHQGKTLVLSTLEQLGPILPIELGSRKKGQMLEDAIPLLDLIKHSLNEVVTEPATYQIANNKSIIFKEHTCHRALIEPIPRLLVLFVKRFYNERNQLAKRTEDIKVPRNGVLDLTQFFDPSLLSKEKDMRYQIIGTVNHMGNLVSGHYAAHTLREGAWYKVSDNSYIEQVSSNHAFGQAFIFVCSRLEST